MGKGRYLVKRLIYMIFVFFVISILMFAIYKNTPGDPVRMMIGDTGNIEPERYESLYNHYAELLGVNEPLPVQYVNWMGNMLRGDFGYSTQYRRPVIDIIGTPMANTVKLNIFSMIVVFMISIPLGIMTAVKKNTVLKNIKHNWNLNFIKWSLQYLKCNKITAHLWEDNLVLFIYKFLRLLYLLGAFVNFLSIYTLAKNHVL